MLEAFVLLAGVVVLLGDVYACRVLDWREQQRMRASTHALERELGLDEATVLQRHADLEWRQLEAMKSRLRKTVRAAVGDTFDEFFAEQRQRRRVLYTQRHAYAMTAATVVPVEVLSFAPGAVWLVDDPRQMQLVQHKRAVEQRLYFGPRDGVTQKQPA